MPDRSDGSYSLGQRVAATALGVAVTGFFHLSTRYLRHCCRFHMRGPLDAALRGDAQVLVAIWHQDVLPFFHWLTTHTRFEGRRRFVMMASRSFDGEVTERIMRPWGFRFVRGSAGKRGAASALRGLLRALEQGQSAVMVADGPLPPPFVLKPGPVHLARESGVPLYVARAWARPQVLVARTWFRMAVPLPRAHVALLSDGPMDVGGSLEDARLRVEERLNRLREEADARLYLRARMAGGTRLCRGPSRATV